MCVCIVSGMRKLHSFEAVVDVLGGPTALAHMVGKKASSIWNWQHRLGRFPARYYKGMIDELAARGFTAPQHLWGQVELCTPTEPASLRRAA